MPTLDKLKLINFQVFWGQITLIRGCNATFSDLPPKTRFELQIVDLEAGTIYVAAEGTSDDKGSLHLQTPATQFTTAPRIPLSDHTALRLMSEGKRVYVRKHCYTGLKQFFWWLSFGPVRIRDRRHEWMIA